MNNSSARHIVDTLATARNSVPEVADMLLNQLGGFIKALYMEALIFEHDFQTFQTQINQIKIDKGVLLQYELDKSKEYAHVENDQTNNEYSRVHARVNPSAGVYHE